MSAETLQDRSEEGKKELKAALAVVWKALEAEGLEVEHDEFLPICDVIWDTYLGEREV